jgi:plastocyanin
MKRRTAMVMAAAAVVALGIASATSLAGDRVAVSQTPPAKTKILVKDNYFEPRSAVVAEDTHVGWKWKGENRHNIRFTKVPRGTSRKGAKTRTAGYWKRTFRKPGTYRYVCKHWAGMRGTVTVRPEPESSSRRVGVRG